MEQMGLNCFFLNGLAEIPAVIKNLKQPARARQFEVKSGSISGDWGI
jgi:hypothetical protein